MPIVRCHKELWNIPKNINFFISSTNTLDNEQLRKHENFSNPLLNKNSLTKSNILNLQAQLSIRNIVLMNQSHSNMVHELVNYENYIRTDSIYTYNKSIACAVITADCIPILITNKSGNFIGCIHAGWKGLADGIIENFFKKVKSSNNSHFKVLIGPSISKKRYEVSQNIFDLFLEYSEHFTYNNNDKYNMDLKNIACEILTRQGITDVTISNDCTYDNQQFFSYRRDKTTGRFISLIWFNDR